MVSVRASISQCQWDLFEGLGGIPEVICFKWAKQIGRLQGAVNYILKRKTCAESQSFPDMRELKNRLSHAVNQHMKSWSRMTVGACRHFCSRIMEDMETEHAGRVWVQAGKLPFEISTRWLRTFMRQTLGLRYGKPRNRRRMLPEKQKQVLLPYFLTCLMCTYVFLCYFPVFF